MAATFVFASAFAAIPLFVSATGFVVSVRAEFDFAGAGRLALPPAGTLGPAAGLAATGAAVLDFAIAGDCCTFLGWAAGAGFAATAGAAADGRPPLVPRNFSPAAATAGLAAGSGARGLAAAFDARGFAATVGAGAFAATCLGAAGARAFGPDFAGAPFSAPAFSTCWADFFILPSDLTKTGRPTRRLRPVDAARVPSSGDTKGAVRTACQDAAEPLASSGSEVARATQTVRHGAMTAPEPEGTISENRHEIQGRIRTPRLSLSVRPACR
ncbi:hypothetical protein [Stella sp.]|uniref:hypothetical protein n=1 Tax=Stella sp. TaxID=2912054 RepID=UPI0035AF34CF